MYWTQMMKHHDLSEGSSNPSQQQIFVLHIGAYISGSLTKPRCFFVFKLRPFRLCIEDHRVKMLFSWPNLWESRKIPKLSACVMFFGKPWRVAVDANFWRFDNRCSST